MRSYLPATAVVCALAGLVALFAPLHAAVKDAKPLTDAEIERNIKDRFSKSKIASNNFRVKVTGGVAAIEGKTGVVQHKGVATRLAKAGGARAVNNRIEVSEAAKTKAAANLAEGRRRAQAHRSDPRSESRSAEQPAPKRTTSPRSSNPQANPSNQALQTSPPSPSSQTASSRGETGLQSGARQPPTAIGQPADAATAPQASAPVPDGPRRAVIRWQK